MTSLRESSELGINNASALRVLSLEISPADTELIQASMTEGGIACEMVSVQTGADFVVALEEGSFDLVLAGYPVASINGISALELARDTCPDMAFIVVSGTAGEEVAIETLKSGATDYVLKYRLERLVPAVRRAIRESEERRERARAADTLRRSEHQFRTLVEQIPAATYTQQIAEPGNSNAKPTLYASPQIESQLGYPPQAFVEDAELWIKLLHPEDRERVLAEERRTDATGDPFMMEYREIARDGRVVWLRDEAVLVRDEEGRPRYWKGVQLDITDRKRAEEVLRETEERFRATFEQAAVGIAHSAPDGRWLRVNQRLCDILGYSCEELLEKTFQEITHPDDLDADLEQTRRLLAGEIDTYSMEMRYIRKDGSIVWINLTASLVREPSEEPDYFISVIEDISERKRTLEALGRSEALYRTVVEQAAENIFTVDVETKRVLEANAAMRRSLGYTPEEFEDLTLYDIVAHDRHSVDQNTQRILEEGQRYLGERGYRRKDGTLVDVEVSASAIFYDGGEAMSIVAHDITERKWAEESLRHSLSVLLALRQAGQILNSTLSSEEIVSRLLEIMRGVSNLTSAVITVPDQKWNFRIWQSAGLDGLWERARFSPEAEAARQGALTDGEQHIFYLPRPGVSGECLMGLCLPLGIKEQVIGVLEAYFPESQADADMVEILSSLAGQAASALENAQLYEELEKRERTLHELVGKLITAQEEERRRVAYDVHDGLAQVAVAAHQRLQAFAGRHTPATQRARQDLDRILELVRATVSDARRIIANLRPTTLDDLGLAATLLLQVDHLRENGYQVEYYENLGDQRLPVSVEIALFRSAQEALTNMRKHAHTRHVRIRLVCIGNEARLEVQDYGRGFDPDRASAGTGPAKGSASPACGSASVCSGASSKLTAALVKARPSA